MIKITYGQTREKSFALSELLRNKFYRRDKNDAIVTRVAENLIIFYNTGVTDVVHVNHTYVGPYYEVDVEMKVTNGQS